MSGSAKSSFVIRAAEPREAAAACEVLRRSIIELCVRDHQNDPVRLSQWLANKTPGHVAGWIADPANRLLVAVADDEAILAVGSATTGGEITLNYVSPDGRLQGVSRAMLRKLEQTLLGLGHRRAMLTSTLTAHDFYLASGYRECGLSADTWPRMEKALQADG